MEPARALGLQALIQACGAFHLLGVGRVEPAQRLARSALEKAASSGLGPEEVKALLPEVSGLEPLLGRLAHGGITAEAALIQARTLRARMPAG